MTSSKVRGYGNGFFYSVAGGTVKNVTFENASIGSKNTGNMYGVVTGYAYGNVTMENITVRDSRVQAHGKVAGMIGMAADPDGVTTLTNCVVENTEILGAYNCAGLIGLAQNQVALTGCSVENVTWTKGLDDSKYITVNGTIKNGAVVVSGLYWDYGSNYLLSGWADYYTDFYYSDVKLDNSDYVLNEGLIHNK